MTNENTQKANTSKPANAKTKTTKSTQQQNRQRQANTKRNTAQQTITNANTNYKHT